MFAGSMRAINFFLGTLKVGALIIFSSFSVGFRSRISSEDVCNSSSSSSSLSSPMGCVVQVDRRGKTQKLRHPALPVASSVARPYRGHY